MQVGDLETFPEECFTNFMFSAGMWLSQNNGEHDLAFIHGQGFSFGMSQ